MIGEVLLSLFSIGAGLFCLSIGLRAPRPNDLYGLRFRALFTGILGLVVGTWYFFSIFPFRLVFSTWMRVFGLTD